MATMILHECDKCGREVRVKDGVLGEYVHWVKAKVKQQDGEIEKLWCGGCWRSIEQPSAKAA